MRVLDSIICAIERGVQLMRAHLHAVDEAKIEAKVEEIKEHIEDKVEDVAHKIETDLFGPMTPAEVERYLVGCAAVAEDNAPDWRSSIVDLLKILNLDASFAARKELAFELGLTSVYAGSTDQNIWLHTEVMRKVAERERIPSVAGDDA